MSLERAKYTNMFDSIPTNMKYPFKRDFCVQLKNTIHTTFVSALLGPRKCGKTIALLQFADDFPQSIFSRNWILRIILIIRQAYIISPH